MARSINSDFGGSEDEDQHDPDLIMDDQMNAQMEAGSFHIETGGMLDQDGKDIDKTGEPYIDYSDLYDNIDVSKVERKLRTQNNRQDETIDEDYI
jgi:hypothetical protein